MRRTLLTTLLLLFSITSTFATRYYVTMGGSDSNSGTSSWSNAFASVTKAVSVAVEGDEIWVANGTYNGAYVIETKNIKLYGGFNGNEGSIDARNFSSGYNTILDATGYNTSVIFLRDRSNATVIDGFTITGGNKSGDGGGILNYDSSPIITNVTISGNTASIDGGGIYNDSSSPTITNAIISGNTAGEYGGGILNYDSSPTITNVTISGNTAGGYGGGILNWYAFPIITNVTISGNTADFGGGILNQDSSPIMTNVTISGNRASVDGGGIYNNSSSSSRCYNSIILGNNSGVTNNVSSAAYDRCLVQGLTTTTTGILNDSDPNIADVFIDPQAPGLNTGGNYRLKEGSPAINVGNDDANNALYDLDGNKRKVGTIDLGAYESKWLIVKFDSQGGTSLPNQYVLENDEASEPAAPTRNGYAFVDWYKESTHETEYDFDAAVTGNITLYAKWNLIAEVEFTVISVSEVYNGSPQAVTPAVTYNNLSPVSGNEEYTYLDNTSSPLLEAPTNAGSYYVKVSFTGDGTGGFSETISDVIPFTITPKDVTIIDVTANNKVYDGTSDAEVNMTAATIDGKIIGDDLDIVEGTATFDDKHAGTGKTVTFIDFGIEGADASNYNLTAQPVDVIADITPMPITVTALNAYKYLGESDPVLLYTFTPALISGDSFTGNVARVAGEAHGSYPIEQGTLTAGSNYAITFIPGTFVIRPIPAAITVQPQDVTVCVGGNVTLSVTATGTELTYQWYKSSVLIPGASSNTYTINDVQETDYSNYTVVVRSVDGNRATSRPTLIWVANHLPQNLQFVEYPNPAITGTTYVLKLAGYTDITKYTWSFSKEGATFSPETAGVGGNETRVIFDPLAFGIGALKVTLEHPCGTREATQTIDVRYPTGVKDVTAEVVKVYPNPTSGFLKISGTEFGQTIQLFDIAGSLKGTFKAQEGETTIDLSGIVKGTYFVQYNGKAYKVIKK